MRIDKYYNNQDKESKPAEHHDEPKPVEHAHTGSSFNLGVKLDSFIENKYLIIGIVIAIIAVNILLRAGLLQFQGMFEPDGFFYYSVVRQAINNHFMVSNYLSISGFPRHNFIGEAPGLVYITVISYFLLQGLGFSALTVMRWVPMLFGIFYALLAYVLAKQLANSRAIGLIAMFLVSVSSGNIARTAGTVYRGDSFISLFIMLALILMIKCFDEKKSIRRYIWAILSGASLSLGVMVWNGAPFVSIVYLLALLLAIIYGFIKADKEILFSSIVLSITLLMSHLLQISYVALGLARSGLQLDVNDFFLFYVPILVGAIIAYYIVRRIDRFKMLAGAKNRLLASFGFIIAVAVILLALFGSTVLSVASPVGPLIAPPSTNISNKTAIGNAVTATTQELQKPSYRFMWSSFSIQLYLSMIGVALFLIYWLLISKGYLNNEKFKMNKIAFIAILSYFLVTSYLQYSAIRFNAIISLPLAIFAAFGIYGIGKLFYHYNVRRRLIGAVITIAVAAVVIFLIYHFYPTLAIRFKFVSGTIVAIYALLVALLGYVIYAVAKGNLRIEYIVLLIVLVGLFFNMYNTYIQSYTAVQADGINPQFLEAMIWLKNNTASNATVLALWPDGSVVEGWGNRTSYMDSVGGENSSRVYVFSKFLFNTTSDSGYLYSIHKPQYLITRNFWYAELGGIAQEGLVTNPTDYGYVTLSSLNTTNNGTATFFTFSSDSYPYYTTELISIPDANGTTSYKAYLGVKNSTRFTLMRTIIFLNSTNSAYNILNTGDLNNSINYTLLISFSGRVINGAYVLGPKLVQSNIFKFTFLCNTYTCPYSSNNVSMNVVYQNGDTRVIKINYLK